MLWHPVERKQLLCLWNDFKRETTSPTPFEQCQNDTYEFSPGSFLTIKQHALCGVKGRLVFLCMNIKLPDCLNLLFFVHLLRETELWSSCFIIFPGEFLSLSTWVMLAKASLLTRPVAGRPPTVMVFPWWLISLPSPFSSSVLIQSTRVWRSTSTQGTTWAKMSQTSTIFT